MTDKRCGFKQGLWNCGSYAFNLHKDDLDQSELCDVHYWQTKAQRQWVGLSDRERHDCTQSAFSDDNHRAIEAKLKELNT